MCTLLPTTSSLCLWLVMLTKLFSRGEAVKTIYLWWYNESSIHPFVIYISLLFPVKVWKDYQSLFSRDLRYVTVFARLRVSVFTIFKLALTDLFSHTGWAEAVSTTLTFHLYSWCGRPESKQAVAKLQHHHYVVSGHPISITQWVICCFRCLIWVFMTSNGPEGNDWTSKQQTKTHHSSVKLMGASD